MKACRNMTMPVIPSLLFLLSIHTADLCYTVKPVNHHKLIGHVIKTIQEANFEICTYRCEIDVKCFSVNFYTKTKRCELNYGSKEMFPGDFKESRDTLYIHNVRKDTRDPCTWLYCLHGGTCQPLPRPYCECPSGFAGSTCQNITLPLKAIGIQDDNIIDDGQLTSSSAAANHEAWRGRLYGQGSWRPVTKNPPPQFNVSFYLPENITYMATQGSPDQDCWATSFSIQYGVIQGGTVTDYPQTISGNIDRNTVIYHPLKPAIVGVKVLIIQPSSSQDCIGLRLELYK